MRRLLSLDKFSHYYARGTKTWTATSTHKPDLNTCRASYRLDWGMALNAKSLKWAKPKKCSKSIQDYTQTSKFHTLRVAKENRSVIMSPVSRDISAIQTLHVTALYELTSDKRQWHQFVSVMVRLKTIFFCLWKKVLEIKLSRNHRNGPRQRPTIQVKGCVRLSRTEKWTCGGRVVILLFCSSYFLMEIGLYWHFCQISLFADVDWALLLFSTVCCRWPPERRLFLSIRSHPRR